MRGLRGEPVDNGGNLPGMIGAIVVVSAHCLKRGMAREGAGLPVITAESIKRGCDRCVAQAVRPGRDIGALAELIGDDVIDASAREAIAGAVVGEIDKQRRVCRTSSAPFEPCRQRVFGVARQSERYTFAAAFAEDEELIASEVDVANIEACDLVAAKAESEGKPENSLVASGFSRILALCLGKELSARQPSPQPRVSRYRADFSAFAFRLSSVSPWRFALATKEFNVAIERFIEAGERPAAILLARHASAAACAWPSVSLRK